MTCSACEERLLDWLDGSREPMVEEHLAACAPCRGLFESARSTAETLRSAPAVVPRIRPRLRWRWPAAAAAVAVIAGAGFLATRRDESPPKRLRIQVVDAANRVEPGHVDAVLDSIEGGPLADRGSR